MKIIKMPTSEPKTIEALMQRAEALAGLTLGEVAAIAHIKVPKNFKREKGWTGQLIELCLGAAAGSKTQQDFAKLGVELKTIPIDEQGKPLETTYVCYAPLTNIAGIEWHSSSVKNKIQKVLWMPIDGRRTVAPEDRCIATPFLWSPDTQRSANWFTSTVGADVCSRESFTERLGRINGNDRFRANRTHHSQAWSILTTSPQSRQRQCLNRCYW